MGRLFRLRFIDFGKLSKIISANISWRARLTYKHFRLINRLRMESFNCTYFHLILRSLTSFSVLAYHQIRLYIKILLGMYSRRERVICLFNVRKYNLIEKEIVNPSFLSFDSSILFPFYLKGRHPSTVFPSTAYSQHHAWYREVKIVSNKQFFTGFLFIHRPLVFMP